MPNPGEELVEAAENLLHFGGSIVRRNALRQALERLPFSAPDKQDITRQWRFTPQCLGIIARAASVSLNEKDNYIRIAHLEQALKDSARGGE